MTFLASCKDAFPKKSYTTSFKRLVKAERRARRLSVGDWVEVKSLDEIMATLDHAQSLDGLPFMSEMAEFCGRQYKVFRSAHKTLETSSLFNIRKMNDAVHLDDLRCNGSAHGGCQAGCLLFWKNDWLRPISAPPECNDKPIISTEPARNVRPSAIMGQQLQVLHNCARLDNRYRCQATEMIRATYAVSRMGRWNPLFYIRDLSSGNVSIFEFIRFGSLAALNAFLKTWFSLSWPTIRGRVVGETPKAELNLQPGEWVRIRTKREIEETLDGCLKNQGMYFDHEMSLRCGTGPYKVRTRVNKIINEQTGKMVNFRDPSIILEGVTCSGHRLRNAMFSPRNEFPFWKEIWLERCEPPVASNCGSANGT